MPKWRLIAGIILVIAGAWMLYQGISAEYSKYVPRFDYVPAEGTIVADIVIGGIFVAAGSVLLIYRQGWPEHVRFGR